MLRGCRMKTHYLAILVHSVYFFLGIVHMRISRYAMLVFLFEK